jgi:rRNA-processing protein FCF1
MLKLMLDTNTLDHIYDNRLTNRVQNATDNGKLQLFATDIQKQEIEGTSNETRKQGIKQVVEEIRIKFIEISAAVVALDQ